jgi:hypothetical protein
LRPAAEDLAAVVCDIEHTSIETAPPYFALSYSWGMNDDGDNSLCRTVLLEGKVQPVTRNLYEGLLRIRDSHASKRLWVDFICINQQDDHERTVQVQQMFRIYASAMQVLAWLGEGQSARADHAIFCILLCFAEDRHDDDIHWTYDLRGEPLNICALRRGEWPVGYPGMLSNALETLKQDIKSFLRRRFFARRWVVQELYFATSPLLCWGPYNLLVTDFENSLDGLMDFISLLEDLQRSLQDEEDKSFLVLLVAVRFHITTTIFDIYPWIVLIKQKQTDLIKAVASCNSWKCSDPRDYLYALLSLDESCTITPDYTASAVSVYTKFTEMLIDQGKAVVLFSNLPGPTARHRDELTATIPSWVLDLRVAFSDKTDILPPYDNFEAWTDDAYLLHCSLPYLGKLTAVKQIENRNNLPCWQASLVKTNVGRRGACDGISSEESIYFTLYDSKDEHIRDGDEMFTTITHVDSSQLTDAPAGYETGKRMKVHVLRPTACRDERFRIVVSGFLEHKPKQQLAEWENEAVALLMQATRRTFEIV